MKIKYLAAIAVIVISSFGSACSEDPKSVQPEFPIRTAFYYPWHPETSWPATTRILTKYAPTLGWYDNGSSTIIRKHIKALEYGKFEAAISSWWDQGSRPDLRLPKLLAETEAVGSPLRWSIYYEPESYSDPSVEEIRKDLAYLDDRYFGRPSYLRVNGKPVVFVWNVPGSCDDSRRWAEASAGLIYVVMKIHGGFRECVRQPSDWHQYSSAPQDQHPPYSFNISPGFWLYNQNSPQVQRDLSRWKTNIRNMVSSSARWKLVISFNEWGEGTAIESAIEWQSPSGYGQYLDALHNDGQ